MKIKNMFETTTQKKMTFLTTKKRMQILPVRLAKMEIIRLTEVSVEWKFLPDVRSGASPGFTVNHTIHGCRSVNIYVKHEWLILMVKMQEIYAIIHMDCLGICQLLFFCWCFFLSCLMGCLFCGPNKFEVEQSESFRWIFGLGDSFQTSTLS